jgi:hypothetical protein
MTDESAVTSISERSTNSLIFFRLGLVPSTKNLRKLVQPSVTIVTEWGDVENHQRLINVHLDVTASGADAHKAALFLIGYEMSIRAFLEDHVSPLPWLVVDQTPLMA